MVKLIVSSLSYVKDLMLRHKRLTMELILALVTAFAVTAGVIAHQNNKKLAESLNEAQNNIEVYQGIANDALEANGVLKMDMESLKNSKDSVIARLDSVMKANKIKPKQVTSAATQTQTLDVTQSKSTEGKIEVKDSIYIDSIYYNNLTKVYYTIKKDSIDIRLKLDNTQYLYTFKTRVYKNQKKFINRLLTLDFKKVDRYKYKIINTNDLLKESDVRIIER